MHESLHNLRQEARRLGEEEVKAMKRSHTVEAQKMMDESNELHCQLAEARVELQRVRREKVVRLQCRSML
eukprot:scaffold2083_cov419-Prasinococcus_capsulatus_cf.AAC.6